MFRSCKKAIKILSSSLSQHGLLFGVSDVIVVTSGDSDYKSTQFFACFGPQSYHLCGTKVKISINKMIINNLFFTVNKYGYIHPTLPNSESISKMCLRQGRNTIEYHTENCTLSAEIYLYNERDKLLISDFDGTATKNDLGGLYHNYFGKNYLHDGYHQLINGIADNGYKIVWMTMRSLPMYQFSKNYIRKHIGRQGPLLMQPQQFLQAAKKQIMKNTGNIKANVIRNIKQIFPDHINPFIGGLGNRQNDAIAYLHSGISIERIYLIDKKSEVHKLDNISHQLTYKQINKQISKHFPKYKSLIKPKHRYFIKHSETHSTNSKSVISLDSKLSFQKKTSEQMEQI